ncbi:MAG: CRISPR-associated protein Cas4 [Muribaculaceae bacterium]|nr:CRISPR-associated protein Cas4 [Muribaculaceae bacterium]
MPTRLYSEDEMLQLSGIQHFVFCPRQWALIHIEQVWADNALTAEGSILHENVDNPFLRETNGSQTITLRGFRLASPQLGLSGIADAVEIYPYADAPKSKPALLKNKMYDAMPIEYKRGKPKTTDCDRMQVATQAIILEEMLGINITKGAIFYWETRHREHFDISAQLKQKTIETAAEMHETFDSGILPKAVKKSHCRNCSLLDHCLPSLRGRSATKYISESIDSITHAV